MLDIKNLVVNSIEGKEIIHSLNLHVNDGEIHVIMGPNGAGKSTICKSIMNHPSYKVHSGSISFDGKEITNSKTNEIASAGIYYISQSPIEIEGITNAEMLRTSLSDTKEIDIFSFSKKCSEIAGKLDLPKSFLHREVNVGMSGGERKKNELFGMWLLEPKMILLDEIDSGLDVDALYLVAQNLIEYQNKTNASILLVTHQQKLIDALNPRFVHIVSNGTIIETGDISLAKEIEQNGFSKYSRSNSVSEEQKNE